MVNGLQAIHATNTRVEILDASGSVLGKFAGSMQDIARQILGVIRERLINP